MRAVIPDCCSAAAQTRISGLEWGDVEKSDSFVNMVARVYHSL